MFFSGDSRSLTFFWWNHLILILYKYTKCLLEKPQNRFLSAQTHTGTGETHRCHLGRKQTLAIEWRAGLALQERYHLICSWKWFSGLLNSEVEYSQFLPNVNILGLLFISLLIWIVGVTLTLKMSASKSAWLKLSFNQEIKCPLCLNDPGG